MARIRQHRCLSLLAALAVATATPTLAGEEPASTPGLYDRPTLVLDPGMHTTGIKRADVDAAGRWVVTGADDKTVRVWSIADGRLERTIRLPTGPANVGKVFAVALDPAGELIAAGGWTRWTEADYQEQVYLFDRASGELVERIDGLLEVVNHLTFSPDGRYLAAALGSGGLRVFDREAGWAEVVRNTDYRDQSYGADFAPDGRLATTSLDGMIRLYDPAFRLVRTTEPAGGALPFGIAFSPDGNKLAVGFDDLTAVDLLDGHTLASLPGPDTAGTDNGDLSKVAWSSDGQTLYAAGRYDRDGTRPVVAWSGAGLGARTELPAGQDTVASLLPLTDGALLVAAQDPYLALLEPDGRERWAQRPRQTDLRAQQSTLAVSFDGQKADFGYEVWGELPARFDVANLRLERDPPADGSTEPPDQDGLPVEGWLDTPMPTLDGAPLPLLPYETSRSLAIHPDGARFVLGADWSLYAFDAGGAQLWRRDVPSVVWAVNITGDGRMAVAGYADGTIRWHDMTDGRELLAFMPLADTVNWVAWTPEGVYAASPGAHGVLRWHVNRGWDQAGEAVPVSDIPEQRRPEVLPLVLQEMDWIEALGLAEAAEIRDAVARRTQSGVKPGAQLHIVAVGVGEYNAERAMHLRLEYADDDASDIAAALLDSQGSLYAEVNPWVLPNSSATRVGILRALNSVYEAMQPDQGDVAVFHFSGHGALVDGKLYLLPYEVDPFDRISIEDTALEIEDLKHELHRLAERGRVLVLLDACRTGAATLDGNPTAVDARLLRSILATGNVTVLTSSAASEVSREDEVWQNGAFTEVLLRALGREADLDKNGVVTVAELTRYVAREVPRLTDGGQEPGMEVRFEHSLFAAGL